MGTFLFMSLAFFDLILHLAVRTSTKTVIPKEFSHGGFLKPLKIVGASATGSFERLLNIHETGDGAHIPELLYNLLHLALLHDPPLHNPPHQPHIPHPPLRHPLQPLRQLIGEDIIQRPSEQTLPPRNQLPKPSDLLLCSLIDFLLNPKSLLGELLVGFEVLEDLAELHGVDHLVQV